MIRDDTVEIRWEDTTWEGSRRAMLRRSLRLTVRERLEALEDMCEVSRHIEHLRASGTWDVVGQ
jgi:hypothetical protein